MIANCRLIEWLIILLYSASSNPGNHGGKGLPDTIHQALASQPWEQQCQGDSQVCQKQVIQPQPQPCQAPEPRRPHSHKHSWISLSELNHQVETLTAVIYEFLKCAANRYIFILFLLTPIHDACYFCTKKWQQKVHDTNNNEEAFNFYLCPPTLAV